MVRLRFAAIQRKASLKRGVTLWITRREQSLPDGSGTVPDRHFPVDAGFFRTLTTQHFRINKTLPLMPP